MSDVVIIGQTEYGKVAWTEDMVYLLTPCCDASGKGMDYETGVGCRGCYEEVDPMYGDGEIARTREEAVAFAVRWFGLPQPDPTA